MALASLPLLKYINAHSRGYVTHLLTRELYTIRCFAVDTALGEFSRDAAGLILDAHFTPEELLTHGGWGHSSWKQSTEFAVKNHVKHLWLFHHKPGRSDVEMSRIEAAARRIFASTDAAREGASFEF